LNDFVLHDWLSYAILRRNRYLWLIDSEPKVKYRQHGANQVGANTSLKGVIYRIKYILSDQVFESIALLIKVLDITSVQLSSRVEILQLAFKARQLRRRGVDQVLVFIALFFYAIKGPKK
jgi:rhamnosyltransferase